MKIKNHYLTNKIFVFVGTFVINILIVVLWLKLGVESGYHVDEFGEETHAPGVGIDLIFKYVSCFVLHFFFNWIVSFFIGDKYKKSFFQGYLSCFLLIIIFFICFVIWIIVKKS